MESTVGILTGAFDGVTAAPEDAIAVEDERIVPDAFVVGSTADRNSSNVGGFSFDFRGVLSQNVLKTRGQFSATWLAEAGLYAKGRSDVPLRSVR